MSLMGSLYIGTSGLQTSQNALHTTAHNMSNVDTIGYTRQQVQQGSRFYNTISKNASAISYQQIGLGVNYSNVKQVRDYFLDKTYRRESGRSAFYEISSDVIEEVENLFQELDGEAFAESIENLWKSVQDLSRDPGNAVDQGVFIQRCSEFLTRAKAVYQGLCDYQMNLNYKIEKQVETANAYAKRISELNDEILKIEAGKIEHANDLRDERNLLIDELSSFGYIDVTEDIEGNVLIKFEGVEYVTSDSYHEIALDYDLETGFATPYWSHLAEKDADGNPIKPGGKIPENVKVFDMTQTISTDTNTDIGSIKSLLFARGDRHATAADLDDPVVYDRDISQSIVMNVQAEFDQLIRDMVIGINDVFANAAADPAWDGTGYMRDADGNSWKVFDLIANNGLTPAGGIYSEDNLKDVKDANGNTLYSLYSIENLTMNNTLLQEPSQLSFKRPDEKIDQNTADALKNIFTEETHTLNPNVKTTTNFINYYNNLISQVANTGSVMRSICENQAATVESTAAAREQILGVSSDEELSNMIMFQNAYNASSRYINVISELLEHIISTLGR